MRHIIQLYSNLSYLKPISLANQRKTCYPVQMLDANNWIMKMKTSPGWKLLSEEISKTWPKTAERALPLSLYQAPNKVSNVICQRLLSGAHKVQMWQEHTKYYPKEVQQTHSDLQSFLPLLFQTPPNPCHSYSHCIKRNTSYTQDTLMMHYGYLSPRLRSRGKAVWIQL